jgi:uncharacterized protein
MATSFGPLTQAVVYYLLVIAMVVAVSFLPIGQALLLIAMLTPTVAVLLMLLVVTRDGYSREGWKGLGLHRLGLKAWPFAIVAPLIVLGLSYAIVWSLGVAAAQIPLGLDLLAWAAFLPNAALNIALATVSFSLAEEIGWRGYLQPRLTTALGPGRGTALTGVLHGFFHVPIMLLTPYYHSDGDRWLIIPLFIAATTAGGLLMGYLRFWTESVWPASVAHSAHNYFWALFNEWTTSRSPLALEYLAGESGILPVLGYGLLVIWVWRRLKTHHKAGVVAV